MSRRGGPIYKIVPRDDWASAGAIVPWADIDRSDGFVHLSAAHQVRETVRKHFAGRDDLVLLEVDPASIDDLRWEPSRGGDLFPHVYADIDRSVVVGVDDLAHGFPVHVPEPLGDAPGPHDIARRLELAEVGTMVALGRAAPRVLPDLDPAHLVIGTAVATRFGPRSPINALKGWGLDTASAEDLDAFANMFGDASHTVEISSHAHPDAWTVLADRGYRAVAIENVLWRPIVDAPALRDDVTLEPVPASEADAWGDMLARGFSPDAPPAPEIAFFGRLTSALPRSRASFVVADGQRVGVCGIRFDHEVALLMGSAVLLEHRGRGYHTAALAHRLAQARALGCRFAKLDVAPGSASHRNAHRAGFLISHTRTVFVRLDSTS